MSRHKRGNRPLNDIHWRIIRDLRAGKPVDRSNSTVKTAIKRYINTLYEQQRAECRDRRGGGK